MVGWRAWAGRLAMLCRAARTISVDSIAVRAHVQFKSFSPLSILNVIHVTSCTWFSLSLAYEGSKVVHQVRLGAWREPGNEARCYANAAQYTHHLVLSSPHTVRSPQSAVCSQQYKNFKTVKKLTVTIIKS